jgi:hypothetical protein
MTTDELKQYLSTDTITFGKYKNGTLQRVLKDRSYCDWLLQQEWFQTNYEYLHNRVQEYKPCSYFFQKPPDDAYRFIERYQFFNLTPIEDLQIPIPLTEEENKCYTYYLRMIAELKEKIDNRNEKENQFDIKAPTRWLKRFEKEHDLTRTVFKEFLTAHDLPNIPYLVERIKKEGGLVYKGAQSFNIAKKRSEEQEVFWEIILKSKYGENLGTQFKYEKCIFDFIHISNNTIFECKLGLKDFNPDQHKKYRLTLEKYRIIYLISYDCVINMEKKEIYTLQGAKYELYQMKIPTLKDPSDFDELIKDFNVIEIDDLESLFG